MEDDYCPYCGAELGDEDALYIDADGCKWCYAFSFFILDDDEVEEL